MTSVQRPFAPLRATTSQRVLSQRRWGVWKTQLQPNCRPRRQWRHLRRSPSTAAGPLAGAGSLLEHDPEAFQRQQLGARVMHHLAGIEQSSELQEAVKVLPVRLEAPRAWHTLTAGVAEHGALALRNSLSPRRYPIPSFHTLASCACQLTTSSTGRRFRAKPINLFLALLFEQIPPAVALAGLPPVRLDRYDLHHGHLFFAPGCRQLGLLLHAKEYPAADAERFEVDLGNCQAPSGTLEFEDEAMDHRNIVWVAGQLACLDMSSPTLRPLLMPGLEVPRTVLEADLGTPVAEVNYFAELTGRKSAERIFVCMPGDVE